MLRTALYYVAGIDRETLATCPATDKMWAAHLGFSLLLSFIVVLGITFHASGYVLTESWMRLLVATVVALTVFMFDRALYQSDWFNQGLLWQAAASRDHGNPTGLWPSLRRFCRIAIRLSISFGLAWIIAVFLELAVFSDTITDKIKSDHLAANQPIFKKIEQYETQLGDEIEQRRQRLAELEKLYGHELATPAAVPSSSEYGPQRLAALDQRLGDLDAQEQGLYAALRDVDAKIAGNVEAMNAEELGQRIGPDSSGRAGAGPRYQFARRQKEFHEARRAELQREIAQLGARRDDLRTQQRQLTERGAALRDQTHDAAQSRRDALSAQIETARAEVRALEGSRLASIEEFRQKALTASDFQKQKDDPLSRMTAYQELKNDPKDGSTITLFSWMTKFLVIFLEIVPVVAKMFFSPPSVYAAKIQAQVEGERRKAMWENEQALAAWESETDVRSSDRDAWVDGKETPHPAQAFASREAEASAGEREAALARQSGIMRTAHALAERQPGKERGIRQPEPRRETVATMGPGPAVLGGAVAGGVASQANQAPDPEPPRYGAQTSFYDKHVVSDERSEVDGTNFDGIDPQLQHEWDDLMEAAERGKFRTIDEGEHGSPDDRGGTADVARPPGPSGPASSALRFWTTPFDH
jgi:uncharacterized protein YlxW (UPF0749 family)